MNVAPLLTVAVTLSGILLGMRIPPKKVKQVKNMIEKEEDRKAEAGKAALIEVQVSNPRELRRSEQHQAVEGVEELNYVHRLLGEMDPYRLRGPEQFQAAAGGRESNYRPLLFEEMDPDRLRGPQQHQVVVGVQESSHLPLLFEEMDPNRGAKCEIADAEGDAAGNASVRSFIKAEPYLCVGQPIKRWADGTDAHYGCEGSIAECARICNSHSSQCKAFVWRLSDNFRSNCYWQASPLAPHTAEWDDHDCYITQAIADAEPGKTLLLEMVGAREALEEELWGPCKRMLIQWMGSDDQQSEPSGALMDALKRRCCSAALSGKLTLLNIIPGAGLSVGAYCAVYLASPSPATEPEGVEMQNMSSQRAIRRTLGA